MSEKLKPCPFCGGEAVMFPRKLNQLWWAYCAGDDCDIYPESRFHDSKEEAIKAWNTRAAGWISVEEALPPFMLDVLGINHLKNINIMAIVNDKIWSWGDSLAERENLTVTHWMPLPEPPQDKDD